MKLNQLLLDFKVSNCQYRCKHCGCNKAEKCGGKFPFDRLGDIALQFAKHQELFDEISLFISDCPIFYSEYEKIIPFCKNHGIDSRAISEEVPIDGMRFNSEFFNERIYKIIDSGLKSVRISLFGCEGNHNEFVGYNSSFSELMRCAEILCNNNVKVKFETFITPKNIHEMEKLTAELKSFGSKAVIKYQYSNWEESNDRFSSDFLLKETDLSLARQYGLSVCSEKEMAEHYKGKSVSLRPVRKNQMWIRIFSDSRYVVPIWQLSEYNNTGLIKNDNVPEIITGSTEYLYSMEKSLPSYDHLIDHVYMDDNPYVYMLKDALPLWWYRYKTTSRRKFPQDVVSSSGRQGQIPF